MSLIQRVIYAPRGDIWRGHVRLLKLIPCSWHSVTHFPTTIPKTCFPVQMFLDANGTSLSSIHLDGKTALFGDTSLAGSNAQVAQVTRTYRDRNIKKTSCTAPGSKGRVTNSDHSSLTLKPQPSHRPTFVMVNQKKIFLFSFISCIIRHPASLWIHTLTMSYHFFRPAIFTGQKSKVWSQSCTRVLLLVSGLRAQCHIFVVQGTCSLSSEVPWRSVSDVALGQQSPSILRCRPFLAYGSNSVHSDVRFLSSLDVGPSQHSTQLS